MSNISKHNKTYVFILHSYHEHLAFERNFGDPWPESRNIFHLDGILCDSLFDFNGDIILFLEHGAHTMEHYPLNEIFDCDNYK